jgi:hypothetical protein
MQIQKFASNYVHKNAIKISFHFSKINEYHILQWFRILLPPSISHGQVL